MKRTLSIVGLVLMIVGLQVVVGHAQDVRSLRVTIPFEFQVGNDSLPPGQYVIQVDRIGPGTPLGSRLILQSSDKKTSRLLTTVPGNGRRWQTAGLEFRKYNETYFLAKVNTSDADCELTRSPAEKELSARLASERQQVSASAE